MAAALSSGLLLVGVRVSIVVCCSSDIFNTFDVTSVNVNDDYDYDVDMKINSLVCPSSSVLSNDANLVDEFSNSAAFCTSTTADCRDTTAVAAATAAAAEAGEQKRQR